MDVTHTSDAHSCDLVRCLPYLFLGTGVVLLFLLVIGASRGFGLLFGATFFIHLLLLLLCVLGSLISLTRNLSAGGIAGWITLVGVLTTIAVELVLAQQPITAIDALVHHLAVPKWWLEAGYIKEIPWHEWSYYPMLLNLGYTGLLILGLDYITPYYHLCYLVVLLGLLTWIFKKLHSLSISSTFGVALVATLPIFLKLGSEPLVDLGLASFSTLAVCFLLLATKELEEEGDTATRRTNLLCFGIALGLAAGTKLNGALLAVCFISSLPFIREWKKAPRFGILLVVIAVSITYAPWLLRNWIWTSNPIYPLFKSALGGPVSQVVGGAPYLPPLLHRHQIYGESWYEIAALPLRIFLGGEDGNPKLFDGSATPFLALFLFAPLVWGKSRIVRTLLPVSVLYLLFALFVSIARVRYLAPVLPFFCVIAAKIILAALLSLRPRMRKITELVLLLSLFGSSGAYLYRKLESGPLEYLEGRTSKLQYLSQRIPEYPLVDYVNRKMPSYTHVYLLGTSNPFYYFDVASSSAGYYSFREILYWLTTVRSEDELLSHFRDRRISHLLIQTARFTDAIKGLQSQEANERWNQFSSLYLVPIVESQGFSLWGIRYQ